MAIEITLPPATEERLRAEAAATGKNISTLVAKAVEARLSLAQLKLQEILAQVHADYQRSGMSDEELETLLQGSLEAVRAERRTAPSSPA